MGAYLSSPVTDKFSSDGSCTAFTYGASSMQGWRISQEDAHNCIPELDSKTAMFAVYDGHGGAEVAQYCAKHLPECIKETEQYKDGELGPALVDAFLKFDSTLVQEDVIKELKLLAGVDENDEEDDDDDPVGRGEADDLRAEADLPLDELLAKYQTPPGGAAARNIRKKENLQSPVVRGKPNKSDPDAGSSSSAEASGSGSSSASNSATSTGLTNGVADNENNLNKEKELRDSAGSQSADQKVDGAGDNNCASSADKISSISSAAGDSGAGDAGKSSAGSSGSSGGSGDVGGCSSSAGGSGDSVSAGSSSSQPTSKASDPASEGGSSSTSGVEEGGPSGSSAGGSKGSDDDGKAGGSGSSSKGGKNGPKKSEEHMDDDDDDSDDDDDEDEWQDLSGEEEEDDEEEEGMDETDEPIMDMSNEEPGSDSGCTACVALLRGDQLVVANAGDSRCVLCRGSTAVDLSVDHKPEDDSERTRIEKAGGKVTADGRVNGGLNLSRAIGDHFYKRKQDLPPEEQMITALPDIQTVALVPEDQFIVIACDGIWNSMSSQECVDFVAERLKDPAKRSKPSLICEELFDHCLAANTYGDGTGCDNMTCIIIVLHQAGQSQLDASSLAPSKRCVGDVEAPEENSEKRPRVEEGAGSTSG